MRLSGPEIITQLREKLQFPVGRHLYGVLGSYAGLARFETEALAQALLPEGRPFPGATDLNRQLLEGIGDADLRSLVQQEGRRPRAIQRRLNDQLDQLLAQLLAGERFVILKQIELLFAYQLDLSLFRTRAANQNHILLLLPGERRSEHVTLFHEAGPEFHRILTPNIVADNHLWELADG